MPYWLRHLEDMLRRPTIVVGILSGTSADAIDAAVCEIGPIGTGGEAEVPIRLLRHISSPHDKDVKDWISGAESLSARRLAEIHRSLGRRFGQACLNAVHASGLSPEQVNLVGSHGQTLYHHSQAPGAERCSLQVGDADQIAEMTGAAVVSDFRARDVAAGGEGAPISSVADLWLFGPHGDNGRRAVLNLGGIANLSVLDVDPSSILGFDVGPANSLLDRLTYRITGGKMPFDVDGNLSASGNVNEGLLLKLLEEDPFLMRSPPKSTGFEVYGDYLICQLVNMHGNCDVNLLSTIAEFTAKAVGQALVKHVGNALQPGEVIIAGGGTKNLDLVRRIRRALSPRVVLLSDDLGVPAQAREAMAFAILAYRAILGQPSTWPGMTGARHPVILGKLSFPAPFRNASLEL